MGLVKQHHYMQQSPSYWKQLWHSYISSKIIVVNRIIPWKDIIKRQKMYKLCKTGTVGFINNGSWTTFDLPNTVYKKGTKYYLHTKFELWNTGRHQIMFRKPGRHRTGEWSRIQHSNTWPHHPPIILSVGPPDLISLLLSATFDKHYT